MQLLGLTSAFVLLALAENVAAMPPTVWAAEAEIMRARGKDYVRLPPLDASMSVAAATTQMCRSIKHAMGVQVCVLQTMTDTEGGFECCTSSPSTAENCVSDKGLLALFESQCDPRIRKPDDTEYANIAPWLAIGLNMP